MNSRERLTPQTQKELQSWQQYSSIADTALVTAYYRRFADPLCSDIISACQDLGEVLPAFAISDEDGVHVAGHEARYRTISNLASGETQLLELAAGLSPRGLVMTSDHAVQYVEVDLPPVMDLKTQVADVVVGRLSPNLHFVGGSALDGKLLQKITSTHFKPDKGITIITEGLVHYLTTDEFAALATNIHTLLAQFGGGRWITDLSLHELPGTESSSDKKPVTRSGDTVTAGISTLTGIDVADRRFRNLAHVCDFLEKYGLRMCMEPKNNWTTRRLTSPAVIGLTKKELDTMRPWYTYAFGLSL